MQYQLKKPNAKLLARKNDIYPFDQEESIEFLCDKNDCGLFMLASHTKKRPFNIISVRCEVTHSKPSSVVSLDGWLSLVNAGSAI